MFSEFEKVVFAVVFGAAFLFVVLPLVFFFLYDQWVTLIKTNFHDSTGTPSRQIRDETDRVLRELKNHRQKG